MFMDCSLILSLMLCHRRYRPENGGCDVVLGVFALIAVRRGMIVITQV